MVFDFIFYCVTPHTLYNGCEGDYCYSYAHSNYCSLCCLNEWAVRTYQRLKCFGLDWKGFVQFNLFSFLVDSLKLKGKEWTFLLIE